MEHLHESEVISYYIPEIGGHGLLFAIDGFRIVYVIILTFMWFMTLLFSKEYFHDKKHLTRYYIANAITYFATVGIFLSAHFMTTFLFFEIMSFSSYIWVIHDEKKESIRAANTYLAVAVIGGLVMLMGLFLLQDATGTLEIALLEEAIANATQPTQIAVAGACVLFGFAAKAGVYPLHIWLPKAHPVAPAPASALLSGALTKTGIFGILIVTLTIFKGNETYGKILLEFGLITMLLGAILALCSVHVKRILACSSMSQIGFILVGISMYVLLGDHNTIAARGLMLHMMNHSLIKLVLFMFAGILMMETHKGTLNELKGYGRGKKALHFGFLMGGLGIGGVPLFNGFLSKTLLHESIVEYYNLTRLEPILRAEWCFLLTGGITVAYIIKIYVAIFWEKNDDSTLQTQYMEKKQYMSTLTTIAFIGSACVIPVMGVVPSLVTDRVLDISQSFLQVHPLAHSIPYYAAVNLQGACISIVIGLIVYLAVIRKFQYQQSIVYRDLWPKWLDLELLLYRPILLYVLPFVGGILGRLVDTFVDGVIVLLRRTIYKDRPLPYEKHEGNPLTFAVGSITDYAVDLYYNVFGKGQKRHKSYVHICALKWERQMTILDLIGRSLSFGLFMFCVGLTFLLVYVLFL